MSAQRDTNVRREKYETAKEAAIVWNKKYTDAREQNHELGRELSKAKTLHRELQKQIQLLHGDVKRWKKCSEDLPDPDHVIELESALKTSRREHVELESKYMAKLAAADREKLLMEGRIEQLQESRTDLKERYAELKEDYRDQKRWARDRKE